MGMNPNSGQIEPLLTTEDIKAFQERFANRDDELLTALEELKSETSEIVDKSITEMVFNGSLELLTQRSKGECPIFQEGEIIPLRGGAFRVGRITPEGMTLLAVKDIDL